MEVEAVVLEREGLQLQERLIQEVEAVVEIIVAIDLRQGLEVQVS